MDANNQSNALLTVEQIRMAKAALGWSNPMIAEKTGLHRNTLNRAENGDGKRSTLELLRHVFEAAGLEFISENGGGAGIRFRERKSR
ncbi:helix-turn-helix domain-containing protein [Methylobacterium sp. J-001]|uniref:helix-turn-helix domain-containing protein n=1 Tax=Methylobacterium sp. J-001 TaxID=2836609 RepID=UPI001FBA2144|nr:helix-turn-helix transcriptional regulator [Methylobacterium sp. J-001]MCJ2118532.1 helix-turn-helix domain-containing protein [Methylobacterium sp. J-001]